MGRLDCVLDMTRVLNNVGDLETIPQLGEVDAQACVDVEAEEAQYWYMARIEHYRERILALRDVYYIGTIFLSHRCWICWITDGNCTSLTG